MPQNNKKTRRTKRGAKSAAAAKASKAGKVKFGDKARFVRTQPVDLPASQVIALAAEQGIPLSENHVYNTRKMMRDEKDVEQSPISGVTPSGKNGSSLASVVPGVGKAQWINTFKSAVFFLGHEESTKILEEMREHHAASVIT